MADSIWHFFAGFVYCCFRKNKPKPAEKFRTIFFLAAETFWYRLSSHDESPLVLRSLCLTLSSPKEGKWEAREQNDLWHATAEKGGEKIKWSIWRGSERKLHRSWHPTNVLKPLPHLICFPSGFLAKKVHSSFLFSPRPTFLETRWKLICCSYPENAIMFRHLIHFYCNIHFPADARRQIASRKGLLER